MHKTTRRRSSSASKEGSNGTKKRFKRNVFGGNRQDFHEFTECIRTAVMNRCNEEDEVIYSLQPHGFIAILLDSL